MTEEKRIFSKNGVKLVADFADNEDTTYEDYDSDILEFTQAVDKEPTPLTKSNLEAFMNYRINEYSDTGLLIKLIGVDEFWNKYGEPVLEEKYFVYVPHTNCETYCKNDLGLAIVSDDTDLDNCEFTEAEIKKYHLEDCEKELIDE
jgi:hypothetical protein